MNDNKELEVNKKNREDYENLMKDSSTNLDGYYDSKNPLVILVLLVLLVIIIVGSCMILVPYFTGK